MILLYLIYLYCEVLCIYLVQWSCDSFEYDFYVFLPVYFFSSVHTNTCPAIAVDLCEDPHRHISHHTSNYVPTILATFLSVTSDFSKVPWGLHISYWLLLTIYFLFTFNDMIILPLTLVVRHFFGIDHELFLDQKQHASPTKTKTIK